MKAIDQYQGRNFTFYNGDSCEILKSLPDDSIHFSIFSPPFMDLYTYSDSDRDIGNCKSAEEFDIHMSYIINQLFRILKPGRIVCVHCMIMPSMKFKDGFIGAKDFPGELIRDFEDGGFIYHSEICIWKNPVTAMQRTKALGLLHKQIKKDACMCRQGFPDKILVFRKPGENPEPVTNTNETFPVELWQEYASPVWMDINQSKNVTSEISQRQRRRKTYLPFATGCYRKMHQTVDKRKRHCPDSVRRHRIGSVSSAENGQTWYRDRIKTDVLSAGCEELHQCRKHETGIAV